MDAKNFSFTPDINKVFFYNPFSYKIFLKVMKSLKKSVEEKPRDITIFLAGPEYVSRYLRDDKDFYLAGMDQKNVYIYRSVYSKK